MTSIEDLTMLDLRHWNMEFTDDVLHLDGVSLESLADEFGSPLYVVSRNLLERAYANFMAPFLDEGISVSVFYSFKTNPVPRVLDVLVRSGAGAEVTTEHELRLARELGVSGDRIIINGTFKSADYLLDALTSGAAVVNIESVEELETVVRIAERLGRPADVALRVNPALRGRRFNPSLATAKSSSPMGILPDSVEWSAALSILRNRKALRLRGLHTHLGSGISSSSPYTETLAGMRKLWMELLKSGFQPDLVNLGGGFGIPTSRPLSLLEAARAMAWRTPPKAPDPSKRIDQCKAIAQSWKRDFCLPLQQAGEAVPELVLEPGRALSAAAQALLLRVKRIVRRSTRSITAICDGGAMGLSPSLWSEYHAIFLVNPGGNRQEAVQTIIGNMPAPIDTVTPGMRLPELKPGDVIAVMDTGAYFTSFGNTFAGPRPAIVMIEDATPVLIRRRETYEEMFSRDLFPPDAESRGAASGTHADVLTPDAPIRRGL